MMRGHIDHPSIIPLGDSNWLKYLVLICCCWLITYWQRFNLNSLVIDWSENFIIAFWEEFENIVSEIDNIIGSEAIFYPLDAYSFHLCLYSFSHPFLSQLLAVWGLFNSLAGFLFWQNFGRMLPSRWLIESRFSTSFVLLISVCWDLIKDPVWSFFFWSWSHHWWFCLIIGCISRSKTPLELVGLSAWSFFSMFEIQGTVNVFQARSFIFDWAC